MFCETFCVFFSSKYYQSSEVSFQPFFECMVFFPTPHLCFEMEMLNVFYRT